MNRLTLVVFIFIYSNGYSQEVDRKDHVSCNIEYVFFYETYELEEVFKMDSIYCFEKKNDNPMDTSRFQIYNNEDTISIDMNYLGMVNSALGKIKLYHQMLKVENKRIDPIGKIIITGHRNIPVGFFQVGSTTSIDSFYNNCLYLQRPVIIDDGCGWNQTISSVIDFSGIIPELIDVSSCQSGNISQNHFEHRKIPITYYQDYNNPCRNELNGLSEFCLLGVWDFDGYVESTDLKQVNVSLGLPDSLVINSPSDILIEEGILTYKPLTEHNKFMIIRYNSGINTVNEIEYLWLQLMGTKNDQFQVIYTKRT